MSDWRRLSRISLLGPSGSKAAQPSEKAGRENGSCEAPLRAVPDPRIGQDRYYLWKRRASAANRSPAARHSLSRCLHLRKSVRILVDAGGA